MKGRGCKLGQDWWPRTPIHLAWRRRIRAPIGSARTLLCVRFAPRNVAAPRFGAGFLGHALGIVDLLSHEITIPTFSSQLTLLIGLGVGVDYALFIVTRHRQGLLAGHDVESALATAIDTSGRACSLPGALCASRC